MRNHFEYPRAIGWALMLMLAATVLWAQSANDVRDLPEETTDLSSLSDEINDLAEVGDKLNDLGDPDHQVLHSWTRPSRGTSLPSAFVPRQTYPDGCGASVSGQMGSCSGTNCISFSATGQRVYRNGVRLACEDGAKPCPGPYPNYYGAEPVESYTFSNSTPNAECNCIEVDVDNGACGPYTHNVIMAGVVPTMSAFTCDDGLAGNPDWFYLNDQGSSSTGIYSVELIPGTPTNNPGVYSVLMWANFGSRSCTYGFSIECRASESLSCALAPIETKIDEIELGPTGKKRMLCHIPPGNPENSHYINVGLPAVDPHVRLHGDCLAPGYTGKSGVKCTCP